jgi:hypothetical protein
VNSYVHERELTLRNANVIIYSLLDTIFMHGERAGKQCEIINVGEQDRRHD